MPHPARPQAPGYLANLMARLFHDISGSGLAPLGIRAEQFPVLVALWFGPGAGRAVLADSLEMDPAAADALLATLAADGLVEPLPSDPSQDLVLTPKAIAARDHAIPAARRANDAARTALSEQELAQFMEMMNRVIDALQEEASSE